MSTAEAASNDDELYEEDAEEFINERIQPILNALGPLLNRVDALVEATRGVEHRCQCMRDGIRYCSYCMAAITARANLEADTSRTTDRSKRMAEIGARANYVAGHGINEARNLGCTDVPWLLAEVARLDAENAALKASVDETDAALAAVDRTAPPTGGRR